jgi:hypothetical protein
MKKEMENLRESYDHSIIDEVWITLPSFIEWLKNKRSETKHYYSINLTILFHSTCIIEGFLFQLLTDNCGHPCENKTMEDRLQIDLFKKLESASWLQYVEFFQLISGKKLSELTDNETWKAITILFQLRNQLTHGKYLELNFKTLERSEPLINGKYAHIYTYYKEVGLIDPKREDFVPGIVSFVTSESADFFYLKTKKLLEDILKGYPDENWLGIVKEAYDLAFEVE